MTCTCAVRSEFTGLTNRLLSQSRTSTCRNTSSQADERKKENKNPDTGWEEGRRSESVHTPSTSAAARAAAARAAAGSKL